MNEELKQIECPFCGSTDIDILAYEEEYHTRRVAECINCGARGGVSDSVEEAIESWNTRPIEDEKDKEIVRLKSELVQAHYILNRIFDMARRNDGVVNFSNDEMVWQISTDDIDNNVGNMEVNK